MLSRPPHPPPDAAAERRRKHAAVQRASRRRLDRGEVLCTVAVEGSTYDLMSYFGELAPAKVDDKDAVNVALGRLLRRAIGALVREERKKL